MNTLFERGGIPNGIKSKLCKPKFPDWAGIAPICACFEGKKYRIGCPMRSTKLLASVPARKE